MIQEFAPAKINLYLHILGRMADGYHELDSLAVFAGVGDQVRLDAAAEFHFTLEGPEAASLKNEPIETNLVVRVARRFAELVQKPLDLHLTLVKNLPMASGIGGGSSDAAAALRAIAAFWGIEKTDDRLKQAASIAGQDTPFCLEPETGYLTGSGKTAGPSLPHTDIVLVNPREALPTSAVYARYAETGVPFSKAAHFTEALTDAHTLANKLASRTNDLALAAESLLPKVVEIRRALVNSEGCLFAQMSGSGATCFGVFADRGRARAAAAEILRNHPDWWVIHTYIPRKTAKE